VTLTEEKRSEYNLGALRNCICNCRDTIWAPLKIVLR